MNIVPIWDKNNNKLVTIEHSRRLDVKALITVKKEKEENLFSILN
jgi:hypothetical protein